MEAGVDFYRDEHDYISKTDAEKFLLSRGRIKVEAQREGSSLHTLPSSHRGKKRPRRSAAVTVQSYVVPDSDDEFDNQEERKVQHESNLQLWIKHLVQLLKAEARKVRAMAHVQTLFLTFLACQYNILKKEVERSSNPDAKVRLQKVRLLPKTSDQPLNFYLERLLKVLDNKTSQFA